MSAKTEIENAEKLLGVTSHENPHQVIGALAGELARLKDERAQLGIDGNCGFALLGVNLQEGEAEFVEIQEGRYPDNQLAACKAALRKLRERLNIPELNCYFGASHTYRG